VAHGGSILALANGIDDITYNTHLQDICADIMPATLCKSSAETGGDALCISDYVGG
jgi:hypothetical protein